MGKRAKESFDPDSIDGRINLIHRAFREQAIDGDKDREIWIEEIYEDHVIAAEGDDLLKIPYTETDGEFSFAFDDAAPVRREVSYVSEAERAKATRERTPAGGRLLESLDEGEGRVWRVTMIQPGTSKNGRRYRPAVLQEAASLYEGARAFDGHRSDADRKSSGVSGLVGWHENVTADPATGALSSDFHISEAAPHLRALFLDAWRSNKPDLVGFSHDVGAITAPTVEGGRRVQDVQKIVEVYSVDAVADPSAGGRVERLVASTDPKERKGSMTPEQLRALLGGDPEEIEKLLAEDDELRAAYDEFMAANPPAPKPEDEEPPPAPAAEEPEKELVAAAVTEAINKPGGILHQAAVKHALEGANLPTEGVERLREALAETPTDGIEAKVKEAEGMWNALLGGKPAQLPGQIRTREAVEDAGKAIDLMLSGEGMKDGIKPFHSIKQAYSAIAGSPETFMGDEDFARRILAESVGAAATPERASELMRLSEALDSTSWANALGDSVSRRVIAEYQFAPLQSWRRIVSDIVPINDFRTQRRDRIGGYNTLPVVAESGPYTALTSPTDEEATYGITKKGGTEQLTLEIIANDDVQALRKIPVNLGRAAVLTLFRGIWIDLIEANVATTYDATAIFDAAHGNTTAATPLAEAGLGTLRTKMVQQTRLGETSGFIGLTPRILVVPTDLFVTADKLVKSPVAVTANEDATTPNFAQGWELVEVPIFTDPNDWYLFADPRTAPTIEVGFYQGREEPELFVQDQPTVGSVFSNDQITWKIRHIWGLTVLDHRGMQKATNA